MSIKTIEEYLVKAGIKADDTFSKEVAIRIVNEHVLPIYKGRVNLTEEKDSFTGYEIAGKLHTIHRVFVEEFEKAIEEEEELA
ncbi:hypothetical protein ACFYKX_11310 [Cytobacillus sp. FJAT-54145]|uniref:Phage protein n=1 Tax=Cytobacillus spartinae TaxID=3299023 RepID=A0ABW6KEF1_9BACI